MLPEKKMSSISVQLRILKKFDACELCEGNPDKKFSKIRKKGEIYE